MKHIYLIMNSSRGAQYGIGTYIRQMTKCLEEVEAIALTIVELESAGKEVTVTFDATGKVRYLRIPEIPSLKYKWEFERYYRNAAYLISLYVDVEQSNIFHLNHLQHLSLGEYLKHRHPTCHTVITIHYLDWCFQLNGNVRRFHSVLKKTVGEELSKMEQYVLSDYIHDKRYLTGIDRLICLTMFTRELLHKDYDVPYGKMTVIYNGLKDEAVFLSIDARRKLKTSLWFAEESKIILFVGRLDSGKGVDILIHAFRRVLEEVPEAHLIVVGDGSYNRYMKACSGIRNKVTFTGKVDKDELYAFYRIADVGVMPSFHEQCSYVGIEMLMHGLPVIGTDSTGLKEMVEDLYCLPLVETEDDISIPMGLLVRWLVELLRKGERDHRSREKYEKNYSLDQMKNRVLNLYNDFDMDRDHLS